MTDFKFYFDDVEVQQPADWRDISITFTESTEFPGIVFSQAIPVKFVGDAYDTLLTAFESGVCQSIEFRISSLESGSYSDIYTGTIFLNSVLFDFHRKTAEVEVKDNSFLAKIQNNKDIKFKIDVSRSKNDTTITAVTARQIDFFTPSTGTYDVLDVECYDVGETLKYLVNAMTDGTVTLECDYLDSSGLCFCTGAAILSAGSSNFAPTLSFKEAFEELHKKLNLSLIIEDPLSGSPVLKIEPLNDIFVETDNVTLSNVLDIKGEADKDKYYQLIRIGSNTFVEDAGSFTFPSPTFLGTRREEYHMLGVCNSSEILDIVGEFVVDSNVIEDIIVNSATDYNDNIFIIQTNRTGADTATRYDDIVSYYYNGSLMNQQVAANFLGAVPQSIANYLGNGDDGFIAEKNTEETITVLTGGAYYPQEPVEYATVISDPNANYNNTTYYFTAPLAGSYAFFASVRFYVNGLVRSGAGVSEQANIKIELVRYTDNTFGTEVESIETIVGHSLDNVTTQAQAQGSFYLDTNNTVRVRVSGQKVLATDVSGFSIEVVLEDSTTAPTGSEPQFRCEATANGGGIYQTYDEADVRRKLYTIDRYPIGATDFRSIVNNIGKYVGVTGTIEKKGWIKELVWSPFSNFADIQLRSKE